MLSSSYAKRTRFEPPSQSKPEAANFPSQTYTFSDSHSLFKAPQTYPAPPKDMWYNVPKSRPQPDEMPTPIFPWEREPDRPKATRVFAEDLPPEPTPAPAIPSPTHTFSTVHYQDELEAAPRGADIGGTSLEGTSSTKSTDDQWQNFQQTNTNAWDSVPGIDNYVRAIIESHGRRGKTQIVQQASGMDDPGSPLLERRNRRESLIITDFPSAIERPSLPVTPAPVRRPMFWGEERDEAGELPAAEGVPDQTEWVCPQCGFSSIIAFDFQLHHKPLASVIAAVVTPPSPTIFALSPKVSRATEEVSTVSKTSAALDALSVLSATSPAKDMEKTATRSTPPRPRPRSGFCRSIGTFD